MKPSRLSANRSGTKTVTIWADTSALDALLDQLGDDVEAAVRPAAQAGAQVLYEEVRQNVSRLGRKTGNLLDSIYQAYSEKNSGPGRAAYHIGWRTTKGGGPRAPHGGLIEFGHIMKYAVYIDKAGQWKTAVRPSMYGKKPPPKGGNPAHIPARDAYYVLRKGGPIQVAARPFIRPAASKFPQAVAAAEAKLLEILNGKKS